MTLQELQELKAQAYDEICQVEIWTKKLQETNMKIREESNKPKDIKTD